MSQHKENDPIVLEDGISGYDTRDVSGKSLFYAFATLVVVTIICVFAALYAWKHWEDKTSSGAVAVLPVAEERDLPELPRLQPQPIVDIRALHEREREALHEYAWLDKQAQIVRIPIDRAMDIIAEKGLPTGREAHIPSKSKLAQAPGKQ